MSARYNKASMIISWLVVVVLTACTGRATPTPAETGTVNNDLLYTQAAETIAAELTQTAPAPATPVAQVVQPTATPTDEPLPPTSTPEPTNTPLPSDTPTPTETPLPTDTPTPVHSPTPTEPPEPNWKSDFQDDFSSARFWTTTDTDTISFSYNRGGYVITSDVDKYIVFSVRTVFYADSRIEVTASRLRGPNDGYYGVICRFLDGGNYYMLGVGSDGWYGILKHRTNQITPLKEGYDQSGAVRTGGAPNLIRADCYGNRLTLYVNGQKIASVEDTDFSSGQIGLAVGTRSDREYQVLFDDYIVYIPE